MKRYPKIKCHFRGCSGEIDLIGEMKELLDHYCEGKKPKVVHLSWCLHTIICPKCMNAVGFVEVAPDSWVTLEENDDQAPKEHSILNPRSGKEIIVGKDKKSLDPYLKKWARVFDREDTDEAENGDG